MFMHVTLLSRAYPVVGSTNDDAARELLWASPIKNFVIASGSSDSCISHFTCATDLYNVMYTVLIINSSTKINLSRGTYTSGI